jgi:hypothetical protein
MMLAMPTCDGYARFAGTLFYLLPNELLFLIFQYL